MRSPRGCKLHAIRGAWNSEVLDTGDRRGEVLVIDDDAVMRELIADWLQAAGYGVRKASNCLAGLAQAAQIRPALFVTDMAMPGPSGAAAISMLRKQHPDVGVIAT